MSQKKVYLAVDIGAGSGRVLAGEYFEDRIDLRELHRFENIPVQLSSGWHWNMDSLFEDILKGLKMAAERYGDSVVSLGIDTWGVDYGLLDEEGHLLNMPYQYRDRRTDGLMEVVFEKVPKKEIYEATGIQFMGFNSLFQLLSEVQSNKRAFEKAEDLLFIPDLLGYWLTGNMTQERSVASTSQLYNPTTKNWDYNLIERLGLPKRLFKTISDPGDTLGPLATDIASKTGLSGVNVITVAGHDTGSAVAGVPTQSPTPAYISSGTWSLIGLELPEPVINDQSYEDSFTNEIGVGNTVRFLKNICGLWLIQESKRYWSNAGEEIPYANMSELALGAAPFRSLIDPDEPRLLEAGRIPEKIQEICKETEQPIPETKGQIIRCIYESLALRYASVWQRLLLYTKHQPQTLHIVGGGCQDRLLNQFAANAIGVEVAAFPVEATGFGNILAQMLADGVISGLSEGRKIVQNSSDVELFLPEDSGIWAEAKVRYSQLRQSEPYTVK
tara:strand:- start:31463 stop:32962 length:1500 start_codon:yes stop_codon:yes gene_type:complete